MWTRGHVIEKIVMHGFTQPMIHTHVTIALSTISPLDVQHAHCNHLVFLIFFLLYCDDVIFDYCRVMRYLVLNVVIYVRTNFFEYFTAQVSQMDGNCFPKILKTHYCHF